MPAPPPARPRAGRLLLALGLVLLSPLYAESLSGYDVSTGDPLALLGGLLILGPLYGCPALLIRELARRYDVRWPGILALATAAGLLQAGVIDQSLFSMSYRDIDYWDDMLLPTLIEPLGFAPYLAISFVVGHVVWSFGAPIALTEALAGHRAKTPWLRWPGLLVATMLYLAAAALILGSHLKTEDDHASAAQIGVTLLVVALLVAGAFTLGRRPVPTRHERALPPPYAIGLLSLVGALTFDFLPSTWAGVTGGAALLAAGAGLLAYVSRSTHWDGRYLVAVAGGAVVARALVAFLATPLGDVPPLPKYAHNTVFLLGSLALITWAYRRSRAGRTGRLGAEVA
ncbi:hypothetical protein GCM10027280_16580 [Micromonospora polyrhachis]|uniref:Cbb3-type cytochrome oxidase subunit 3 n=1 Tax=Micromonospora polyrhachis TaxID=1282883 RepID=A0A7W7SP96_9ACTN|nr:hypothetical protein [Micromonospora polyrhachis]MBB4958454.1 cbb3-type cytochrome oxidase subunit 3 [Micromonospora polyrhachis]